MIEQALLTSVGLALKTRDEVRNTLIEGFFPQVEVYARPVARPRTGLTQLGLPYAQDAAITRHIAAFLGRQAAAAGELPGFREPRENASFIHPTAVLFNGGIFKSPLLSERILNNLNSWLATEQAPPARLLSGALSGVQLPDQYEEANG